MKLTTAAAILFQLISIASIPVDAKQIRRRAKDGKKGKKDKCKSAKQCKKVDKSEGTLTATIWPYPNSQSSVEGDVKVKFSKDGSLKLNAALRGVDADCDNCGIHIHSGTSCDTHEEVMGHYWNEDEGFPDPWFPVDPYFAYYTSNNQGVGTAEVSLTTGFGFDCNVGRTVVVHAGNGDRIGCGVLSAGKCCKKLKATVEAYPGYLGDEEVTGDVYVDFDNKELTMTASLEGADPSCSDTSANTKCGIHIHAGITCDNENKVGGHYWDKFADPEVLDPWFAKDPYNAIYDDTGAVDFTVTDGYDCSNNVGHAVVVHKAGNGERVGCGILEEVE